MTGTFWNCDLSDLLFFFGRIINVLWNSMCWDSGFIATVFWTRMIALTQRLIQRDELTQGGFYTRVLLNRDAFNTEMVLHTGA